MIIIIDPSVFADTRTQSDTEKTQLFLNRLTIAIEDSNHLFLIDSSIIPKIEACNDLLEHSRKIIIRTARKSIYFNDYFEKGAHLSFTKSKKNLGFEIDIIHDDQDIIIRYLAKPCLVLEDASEKHLYQQIIKSYSTSNNRQINVSFKTVHGGGDTTHLRCAEEYLTNEHVYCICDSDKKTPTDSIGGTARKAKTFFQKINRQSNLLILDCHEIENLLPLNVLNSKAKQDQALTIRFLEMISAVNDQHYLYYDFKKSHSYHDIFIARNTKSEFWRDYYAIFHNTLDKCPHAPLFSGEKSSKDALIPGVGALVYHVKDDFAKELHSDLRIDSITPTSVKNAWNSLGVALINWFVALPPLRV
ncbi:MAG: hypothetical protein CVV11_10880 [Gammaproteobacteria bacterium HGW-Gammaproteobacteria-15]|nr:MAG: hypothetical protein CVV11_10880 [Gammaproteobacteria bacterium HGW-Gammaproteobacteria-15]